jgi:nitrite reductase/ring-hydroxylating ferredoxin subunit
MSEDVPVWRRDFPYTAAGEERVTRREFARYLALASGAFAAGTVGVAAWATTRVVPIGAPRRLVALDALPVGGSHLFRYPHDKEPAILVRLGEDELVAWSQKCTHLGCVVYYEPEHDLLECPCHEGFFDVRSGLVVAGPPERPLPRIALEIRDGEVWAVGYEITPAHTRPGGS